MKIVKSQKEQIIYIKGVKIHGVIEEDRKCSKCQQNLIYSYPYDTYFCPCCNQWTEKKCGDSSCYYCKDRPDRPLE